MMEVAMRFLIVIGIISMLFLLIGIAGILCLAWKDKVEQKHKRKMREFYEKEMLKTLEYNTVLKRKRS